MGPSTWRHLAGRLVDFVTSRALTLDEQAEAQARLRAAEVVPFFGQPVADLRHALTCARDVASSYPQREDLIRAALLHDVGKRHAGLGAMGRIAVTAWAKVGGPTRGRAGAYVRHGEVGALELEEAGAEDLVVDFARHHHGQKPVSITEEDWVVLQAADRAKVRRKSEDRSPERGR